MKEAACEELFLGGKFTALKLMPVTAHVPEHWEQAFDSLFALRNLCAVVGVFSGSLNKPADSSTFSPCR